MSLITQCPACTTMFRVVPDQLRISEGWVRCGHCDEVFDANAHLKQLDESLLGASPATPPATQPEPEQESAAAPAPFESSEVPAPDTAFPEPEEDETYDWDLDLTASAPQAPGEDALSVAAPDAAQQELDAVAEQLYDHAPATDAPPEADSNAQIEPYLDEGPQELSSPDEPFAVPSELGPLDDGVDESHIEHAEPDATPEALPPARNEVPLSFMPRQEKPSRLSRIFNHRLLVASSVLMSLGLAGQFVFHQRDRIAATYPVAREALTAFCDLAACTISPPKHIEAIAIDSSAFTSVKAGVYMLQVTLKNSAAMDLAVPALELTLTDLQDRPLLRWVVRAEEFHGQGVMTIAAGSELSASLPISVRTGAAAAQITGYKLLAFYP